MKHKGKKPKATTVKNALKRREGKLVVKVSLRGRGTPRLSRATAWPIDLADQEEGSDQHD